MENEKKYFEELLIKSSIEVNDEAKGKMLNFLELLYEKNQVINLTAIRDKEGMLEKHFIDSLLKMRKNRLLMLGRELDFQDWFLRFFIQKKAFC